MILCVEKGLSDNIPGAHGQLSLAVLGSLQALLEALDPMGILTGASGAESCTGALCGAFPPHLLCLSHGHTMNLAVPFSQ